MFASPFGFISRNICLVQKRTQQRKNKVYLIIIINSKIIIIIIVNSNIIIIITCTVLYD